MEHIRLTVTKLRTVDSKMPSRRNSKYYLGVYTGSLRKSRININIAEPDIFGLKGRKSNV
jgi:hypothetical protein